MYRTGGRVKDIYLRRFSTWIGRAGECDVVIADKRISSKHCVISLKTIHEHSSTRDSFGCELILKDISTHGTWVNQQKVPIYLHQSILYLKSTYINLSIYVHTKHFSYSI